jgi:hypothetical protein
MLTARFMKLFALFRFKKYAEPMELNLSRPHFSFITLKDFEDEDKEIDVLRMKRIEAERKGANINNTMANLIKQIEGDKVSDLHTVKEESDLDRHEEEFDYPKGQDRD